MDNEDLLKSSMESKHLLESYAREERGVSFAALHKKVSTVLSWRISYEYFWRSLAIVNYQTWKERRILLTAIVRCNHGLPGMRFWVQAKSLGVVADLPEEYREQKDQALRLVQDVFTSYRMEEPVQVS